MTRLEPASRTKGNSLRVLDTTDDTGGGTLVGGASTWLNSKDDRVRATEPVPRYRYSLEIYSSFANRAKHIPTYSKTRVWTRTALGALPRRLVRNRREVCLTPRWAVHSPLIPSAGGGMARAWG